MLFRSKLDSFLRIHHDSADRTYGNHWIFDEIMQKVCFKIGVGKSMKIFFIRNAPNNIAWPQKVLSVMPVTMFPRKTMKNSRLFMFVDYCRESYCKYIHYKNLGVERAPTLERPIFKAFRSWKLSFEIHDLVAKHYHS